MWQKWSGGCRWRRRFSPCWRRPWCGQRGCGRPYSSPRLKEDSCKGARHTGHIPGDEIFGDVVNAEIKLSALGQIAWGEWMRSTQIRKEIRLYKDNTVGELVTRRWQAYQSDLFHSFFGFVTRFQAGKALVGGCSWLIGWWFTLLLPVQSRYAAAAGGFRPSNVPPGGC